jgi:hypothetical protein
MPPDRVPDAINRTIDSMLRASPPYVGRSRLPQDRPAGVAGGSFRAALEVLAAKLGPDQAASAADRTLDAIKRASSEYRLAILGDALSILAPRLDQAAAARVFQRLIDDIESAKAPDDLDELPAKLQGLAALAVKPTPQQISIVVERIRDALAAEKGVALRTLAEKAASLAPLMSQDALSLLATEILAQVLKRGVSAADSPIGSSLAVLIARLPPAAALPLVAKIGEAVAETADTDLLAILKQALEAAIEKTWAEDPSVAIEATSKIIERTSDPDALEVGVAAFTSLAPRMKSDSALAIMMFETLKNPWTPVRSLHEVIRGRFPDAPEAADAFWPLMAWGRTRFASVVDFAAPPRTATEIASLVKNAMGGR